MTRFLAQRDEYSCGPIAIINALKWLGYAFTGADLPKLRRWCQTDKYLGTPTKSMTATLAKLGIKSTLKYRITFSELNMYLKQGKCVIIGSYGFGKNKDDGHWYFVPEKSGDGFRVINLEVQNNTVISKEELKRVLKDKTNDAGWPVAIVIEA
jgi:hypothetical protein